MKKFLSLFLKKIPVTVILAVITACFIIYPKDMASGVKNGLYLLGNDLIPTLFPFMVLSSYISQSNLSKTLGKVLEKPFQKIFKTSGYGIVPFILGVFGGYPVGAKTLAEFYRSGKLTQNETERLFYWCINPSPAFVVTAVGTFMLGNTVSGVIIYASCILASLTIGFFCRFLSDGTKIATSKATDEGSKNIFVKSVSSGSEAMFSVCGWVLTFSALSSLCEALKMNDTTANLIKSVMEVTTGCKNAATANLPLPIIAAIIGFGGFAVICQVGVYTSICKVQTKLFICSRLITSALCTLYTSALLKLFPQATDVFVTIEAGTSSFTLYHSIGATVILLIMCALLILEVDNRKKVC